MEGIWLLTVVWFSGLLTVDLREDLSWWALSGLLLAYHAATRLA